MKASTARVRSDILQRMKEDLNKYVTSVRFVNGPTYLRRNKLLALGYFNNKEELNAIFHLTECHGSTLRQKIMHTFDEKDVSSSHHEMKISDDLLYELPLDCLSLNNEFINDGPSILLDRLQKMPQEWTIVQLTFSFDLKEPVLGRTNSRASEILKLHLTRLPCGSLVKDKKPCTVMIQPPGNYSNDGLFSILEVIRQSINKLTSRTMISKKEKLKRRKEAGDDVKGVVSREIISTWIKEWCCLMIGTLCGETLNKIIKSTIDTVVSSLRKNKLFEITETKLSILYQIVDGCAHLNDNEISRAVEYCVGCDNEINRKFVSSILKFKEKYSCSLMKAKRNPVLLVLDDGLELVPWELLPIYYKHPVSRVPSVHFAYALYEKHKDNIVNGNRIVKNTDTAFYIINPEGDLENSERNLLKFIEQRHPNWNGLKGEKPTGDVFVRSLLDYNVFMYCGHGDGAQYLNPEEVSRLNCDVVPLLFGCSSASKKSFGEGGKNEMMGFSEQLLMAGCPCLVGMLWPVTTTDTDLVTIVLLNMAMSGDPVDINEFIGSEEIESNDACHKEPELLRALKSARSAAKLYTNGAALVARGIPVQFQE